MEENNPTIDSLSVANAFDKHHSFVLKKIRELIDSIRSIQNRFDVELDLSMYLESEYMDSYGRTQKKYEITRDGFSLLVMAFPGDDALYWKVKFLMLFNRMYEKIVEINESGILEFAEEVYNILDEYRMNGSNYDEEERLKDIDQKFNELIQVRLK